MLAACAAARKLARGERRPGQTERSVHADRRKRLRASSAAVRAGTSSSSDLVRTGNGATIAFVTNPLPADFVGFLQAVTQELPAAAAKVQSWPTHDLFTAGG